MATRFHCNTFVTKENIRATVGISVEMRETDRENQEGTQCRQLYTSGWNRKLVLLYQFPQGHTQKTWDLHEGCCENLRAHITCCLYDIY
jgi:phage-related protein